MRKIKEGNGKQIGGRILQAIIIAIFNSAIGFMLIAKMIEQSGNETEITYGDALTNKVFDSEYYHGYNDGLVYVFIIVGLLCSFFFIRLLGKNKQANKDRELAEKEYDLKKKDIEEKEKQNKAINKMIERLSKDR